MPLPVAILSVRHDSRERRRTRYSPAMTSPSRDRVRCSRSTAIRSPIAPTTRCRNRSAARAAGPANALVGFANFLLRLWDAEQPAAVVVGWDSLEVPTYRNEALPGYQVGPRLRRRDPRAARRCCPELVESFGFIAAQGAGGYEADDFLAAAAATLARAGGRRHVRPRRVPARQRARDRAPAGPRRQRARADRAGRGARALRRRPGAGAGLHRAAR